MKKRFSYVRWAKNVAAACLESDVSCGFEVAENTPNPNKARKAMEQLIKQLKKVKT